MYPIDLHSSYWLNQCNWIGARRHLFGPFVQHLNGENTLFLRQVFHFFNYDIFRTHLCLIFQLTIQLLAPQMQKSELSGWMIKFEKPLNTGPPQFFTLLETSVSLGAENGGNIIISVNIFGYKLARPLSGTGKKWGKYISILGQNKAVLTPLGWHNKLFGEIRVAESKIKWK